MRRAGFVLVGGSSSRMGRDKALLPYGGATLAEFVAARVEAAAGSAVLVGAAERYGHLNRPVIPDLVPGQGPLGGIQSALSATTADWNLIVACDLPRVEASYLRLLLEEAEAADADCLVPVSPGGRPEPLCAVYHRRALGAIARSVQQQVRRVTAALDGLNVLWREEQNAAKFLNVNTPEDWAQHG